MISDLLYRLRSLTRRGTVEGELDDELRFHMEREIRKHMDAGLPRDEATRRARMAFGGLEHVKEECRDSRGISMFDVAMQDLRYALRVLFKSPGFTVVAVLSLALGIGANTAVFSLVNAVLLRPLPYPQPERIVHLTRQIGGEFYDALSIPQMQFWQEHSTVFASIAGHRGTGERTLVAGLMRDPIKATAITTDFFRTLGIAPVLGREFEPDETRPGGPRGIILSDALWRRIFSADPNVLGRAVTLDEDSYTVVGVLPPSFWFPQATDAFTPLRPSGGLMDTGTNTEVLARLRPGITPQQAQAEMATIFESYRRAFPNRVFREERGIQLVPYRDRLVGEVRTNLLVLFGAVLLLLLICCSNLASLLLARLAARQKEIAIRLALGGGRARLLGQFLVENLVLGVMGGCAGVLTGYALLRGLIALVPFDLPVSAPVRLDGMVLLFAAAIALGTVVFFSVPPVLSSRRLDANTALNSAGRSAGTGPSTQRARSVLVVAEVALSVALLVSAGLLIQTLYRLHHEHLGFSTENLLTFNTPFAPEHRRNPAEQWSYERAIMERLQAIPGVRSVAAANSLPLAGWNNIPTQREGHPEQSIGGMEYRIVTPGYFEAMSIPVLRGRTLTAGDTRSSTPVMVVNETVARAWWPKENPIGDHVVVGRFKQREFPEALELPREVVGVVGDTKTASIKFAAQPTVYIPAPQAAHEGNRMSWVVRYAVSEGLAEQIRRAVTGVDPAQRITRLQSMTQLVAAGTSDSRFDAWLFGSFAGLALALTAIGVYGLLSFSVAQRRREIGTRIALGATRPDILRMVLKHGVGLTTAGLVLGLAGAFATTRLLAALLYGVRPKDPFSFVAVAALLLAVGLAASYLPARRATKVDPIVALRYE